MSVAIEIQQWFDNGKNYEAGVALFAKLCSPGQKILLKTLQKGPTVNYSVPKLERVLWELREKFKKEPPPAPPLEGGELPARAALTEPKRIINVVVEQKTKSSYTLDNAPAAIIEADREWKRLYKECGLLREQIRNSEDEITNHERARKIMEKELQVKVWQAIVDEWRATGKLPEPPPTPPLEGGDLPDAECPTKIDVNDKVAVMKRIANLRSNITKRKKKGDTERVEAFTRELNYLLPFVK